MLTHKDREGRLLGERRIGGASTAQIEDLVQLVNLELGRRGAGRLVWRPAAPVYDGGLAESQGPADPGTA